MNRLLTELQRLYDLSGLAPRESGLRGADDGVRVAVVGFQRAADWKYAARLYQEVQAALELPPPAISISGSGEYQLWFSFSEPVPVDQAGAYLRYLRERFLGDMPHGHLELWPDASAASSAELRPLIPPPALDANSGKWSAFIEPSLGSLFVDEPGLEMAPNEDRQADLLAGLRSIRRDEFLSAFQRLAAPSGTTDAASRQGEETRSAGVAPVPPLSGLGLGGGFADPKHFLLALMNDPAARAEHRIEAAKALLPYFQKAPH